MKSNDVYKRNDVANIQENSLDQTIQIKTPENSTRLTRQTDRSKKSYDYLKAAEVFPNNTTQFNRDVKMTRKSQKNKS